MNFKPPKTYPLLQYFPGKWRKQKLDFLQTQAGAVLESVPYPTRANNFLLFQSKTQLVPICREVADLRQRGPTHIAHIVKAHEPTLQPKLCQRVQSCQPTNE